MRTTVERRSGDSICKLTVWGLLVYKVELLPCYMDHFCFFDHKTPAGTRNLFGRLVWNRLNMDHHYLHHKDTIIDHPIRCQVQFCDGICKVVLLNPTLWMFFPWIYSFTLFSHVSNVAPGTAMYFGRSVFHNFGS